MSKFIINDKQPFGVVYQEHPHASTMANAAPHSNANLGSNVKNGNNGVNIVESFADKNPNAHAYACRNGDNPFAPVGKSFSSKVNLTERYENAN